MTRINISKDKIELRGHAKDIVCASISTAVYFLIHTGNCKYTIDNGIVTEIDLENVDIKPIQLFTQYIKELEGQHPQNIKVTYEV